MLLVISQVMLNIMFLAKMARERCSSSMPMTKSFWQASYRFTKCALETPLPPECHSQLENGATTSLDVVDLQALALSHLNKFKQTIFIHFILGSWGH